MDNLDGKIKITYYNSFISPTLRLTEYSIVDPKTNKGIYGAVTGIKFTKKITNKYIEKYLTPSLYETKPTPFPHKKAIKPISYMIDGNIEDLVYEINRILESVYSWKQVRIS